MRWPSRAAVWRMRHAALALVAGLLVAASMPPWGWWPLAFLGLALWEWLLAGQRTPVRARRTFLVTIGWFVPTLSWMWEFSIPGYVVVLVLFGAFHTAAVLAMPGPPDDRWRWLVLPSAITAAEALRFCFPFGGVPLASLPIGQAGGPFAGIVRIGGAVLLTFVTAFIGTNARRVLQPFVTQSCPTATRYVRAGAALAFVPAVLVLGTVVPRGSGTGTTASIAIVQGGGPQGTRAATTTPGVALRRALTETAAFDGGADLVVWPENILNTIDVESSAGLQQVAAEAARLQAPISLGITERDGPKHFRNAQVVVMPDGSITSRYEKKRRVPFGEYMPMRSFLDALGAPTYLVPRDAVAGSDPAVLSTPIGTVGTVISWEVFFGGRAREAVRHGAEVIINPTNGASYSGSVLQTQQLASSRLRAMETGRWVIQVAPTGFSAFVSPNGTVYDRIGQTEAAWRMRTVELRSGLTWYERTGDKPWVLLVLLLWSLPTFDRLYRRRREVLTPR